MLLIALLACSGTKDAATTDDSAVDSASPSDSADSGADTEPLPPDCTGIQDLGDGKFFLEVEGASFWVLVPAEAPDCAPVFLFGHGGSSPGGTDNQGHWRDTGTGLAALAPTAGFILVVPFLENSPMTEHAWQESDAELLDAMVEEVASRWDIDRNRVLFAGTSAGGHMASYYGLYRPQVPKAIAVLSAGLGGYFDYPETEPEPLLPFYVAHDPDDEIVPYSYSEHLVEQLELHGHEYVFEQLDLGENGHFANEAAWAGVVGWWMEWG
ncbi:MAG: hypothetical protein H6741_05280 [Alphaproteobacteria bacterium]|nr:hypothetical protein [Alphaproteobacteria bacterium]MCB9792119.1 hypothetical protein [Alphaproteobacteria bacterium]